MGFKVNRNNDNYVITEQIGSGGFSKVFSAFHTTKLISVAIKVLKPIKAEKIVREIKALSAMRDAPNAIQLLDIIKCNKTKQSALVFEQIDNLQDSLYLFPTLPATEVRRVLYILLETLNFAHEKNIAHRDVKPSNVLVNDEGQVRLIDWGLADFTDKQKRKVTAGTLQFKAPEMLLAVYENDARVDIWSLGVMFAAMVTF